MYLTYLRLMRQKQSEAIHIILATVLAAVKVFTGLLVMPYLHLSNSHCSWKVHVNRQILFDYPSHLLVAVKGSGDQTSTSVLLW